MSKNKLYAVQAQVVQENGKRPRAGCNIQLIKMVQDIFSPEPNPKCLHW